MSDSNERDDAEERAKRAERLRAQIRRLRGTQGSTDGASDSAADSSPAKESPREFVERRMREERRKRCEQDEQPLAPDDDGSD